MAAPVQIIWSFDTTGSMSSCLESIKSQIKDLSRRLLSDIPTLEIGLIAHGDYCDRHSSYLIKTMPFSTDPEEINKWVSGVGPTGGGDAPEAYEIALRAAVQDFAWKGNARKVLALIGDEVPHEASFAENTDNVDWNAELAQLAEKGIRCFGVQCLNNSRATYFYKALAERTDGLWLPMQDLRIIKDVFLAVCLQVADTKAFDQFKSQLAADGPVASALVPLMTRLAKKKQMSNDELAALCGIVGKLASEHGQPPKEVFLPIQAIEVSAAVERGACEIELVQTFTNRKDIAGKGASFEYRFALPQSAAVFFFEARLSSGRVVKGVVKGREDARNEYQRAISRGDKAFLMEEKHADMFSMELGNLELDETVTIVLKYVTELEEVNRQTLRLRLPQHVAPRSGGRAANGMLACYPITVNVTPSASTQISGLQCLTNRDRLELNSSPAGDQISGLLKLLPEHGLLNSDLVFDMDLASQTSDVSIEREFCDTSGSTMVQVAIRPDASEPPLRNLKLALVLDASCSMQGTSFQQAKEAAMQVLRCLATVGTAVSCSCHLMRHESTTEFEGKTAEEASAWIECSGHECGGGTNFDAAFDTVRSMTQKVDAILVVSDGQGPESLHKLFAKASGGVDEAIARVSCFAVGPDPGLELLEGLAEITGGVCEAAASLADVPSAAQRLAAALTASPVEVRVQGPADAGTCEQWPARVLAYPGRRAVAYLLFKDPARSMEASGAVVINGDLVSTPIEPTAKGQMLHRLGVRKRITELERFNVDSANDEAIRKLALEYGLTSSQTSFLAVDEQATTEGSSLGDAPDAARSSLGAPCDASSPAIKDMDSIARCARDVAEMASLVSRDLDSHCSLLECRAESLDSLSAGSRCLSATSASFSRKTMRKRSLASATAGAVSGFASRATALGGAIGGGISSLAERFSKAAPALLGPTSEAPTKDVAIIAGGKYFEGFLQHRAFGPNEVSLKLILDKVDGDGRYVGRWTAMGQAEAIALTLDAATGAVNVEDTRSKKTLLKGNICFDSGSISGEVIQEGVGGGRFHLAPKPAQEELTDTDGDHLVFARLLDGGVAEYCNGRLVVAALKTVSMQTGTGLCQDGEGQFTVPAAGRSGILSALEGLLRAGGVSVTVTD